MNLAPIVLFVYNRPNHTKLLLESLKKNLLSKLSIIYIYCDGPKANSNIYELDKIKQVRNIIKKIDFCKEIYIIESQDNIKSDRKEDDVLFEILLKYGLDLTLPIEEKVIEGKKVFNVGFGALFICLGNDLTSKVAEGIGQWKETLKPETCRVIFKDGGFTDVEKTNSVQTLKRFGIQEIKSI